MLDDIARYNQERWEELAKANVRYSRPALDLTVESARELVDPEGMMGSCRGKRVLCLAGGGGQQSVAYALLGAQVTVLDITETQLKRDRLAAKHYDVDIDTQAGDMRDLSRFDAHTFDIVHHAHSINFVPEISSVFREVGRVLRPGGLYRLSFTNPFIHGTWEDDWDGNGYPIHHEYVDGEVVSEDPGWYFEDEDGNEFTVEGPIEFRHTLSTLVNELTSRGFVILGLWEDTTGNPDAEPGTWDHFKRVAAPWLTVWCRLNPRAFMRS
jgi:ubiquinone/menaquinone biosynthesis C-methylase UbiE